jgi:hypothetical protein
MKALEPHPYSKFFPEMTEEEYQTLKDSIQFQGYKGEQIETFEGKILVGRHRYKACLELNIDPPLKEFEGTKAEAADYVVLNNTRRNITKAQWTCAAAEYYVSNVKPPGWNGGHSKAAEGKRDFKNFVSKMFRVGQCQLDYTVSMLKYDNDLFQKVKRGQISVKSAYRLYRASENASKAPEHLQRNGLKYKNQGDLQQDIKVITDLEKETLTPVTKTEVSAHLSRHEADELVKRMNISGWKLQCEFFDLKWYMHFWHANGRLKATHWKKDQGNPCFEKAVAMAAREALDYKNPHIEPKAA